MASNAYRSWLIRQLPGMETPIFEDGMYRVKVWAASAFSAERPNLDNIRVLEETENDPRISED